MEEARMKSKLVLWSVALVPALGAFALEGTAFAQDAAAGGEASGGVELGGGAQAAAEPAPAPAPAADANAGMALPGQAEEEEEDDGETDHDAVVGHFGIGYLGSQTVPIATAAGGRDTVTTPVIGMRYWLNDMMGIDAGLGFGLTSASTEVNNGAMTTTTDLPGVTAFLVHVGVPFSLAQSEHFSFQVVPELNLGLASATIKGVAPNPDTDLSGFSLDLGARAGAEVQFGFIDIPQLSLQAGVGLGLRMESGTATVKSVPETSGSFSGFALGTNVGGDPWDIFTSSITALYYF
jgi:hypothetical protein